MAIPTRERAATPALPARRRVLAALPPRIPWLTAAWSLGYAVLMTAWSLGAGGWPFGPEGDPDGADSSLLGDATAGAVGPVFAVLCLAGAAIAALLAGRTLARPLHRVLVGFAAGAAIFLTVLLPDMRLLTALGYTPIFLAGAPFGWPPVSYTELVPWPVLNQILVAVGGLLWAATAVIAVRRAGGACEQCGRPAAEHDRADHWTSPARALRWGRWAVGVAAVIPTIYAVDRLAWVVGIPLGVSEELLREVHDTDLRWAALGLALGAIGGAVLTVGLVQRWGEVFPRWIPFLRGRRVPPAVAIVPASVVSVAVLGAGVTLVREVLTGPTVRPEDFPAVVPGLLWPFWGLALAVATYAYYLRRRGTCRSCGRG